MLPCMPLPVAPGTHVHRSRALPVQQLSCVVLLLPVCRCWDAFVQVLGRAVPGASHRLDFLVHLKALHRQQEYSIRGQLPGTQ